MLVHVPASLDGLLSLLRPCFTQPTFQTFRALVVGQVSQTGLRTVCGMLIGARLSTVWHHARAHRFFSHARWRVDELGLRVAELICERLCDPAGALLVAIDDTLLHRLGRKVHGSFWHHDATANSQQATVAWGNNWVVVPSCSASGAPGASTSRRASLTPSGPRSPRWRGKWSICSPSA